MNGHHRRQKAHHVGFLPFFTCLKIGQAHRLGFVQNIQDFCHHVRPVEPVPEPGRRKEIRRAILAVVDMPSDQVFRARGTRRNIRTGVHSTQRLRSLWGKKAQQLASVGYSVPADGPVAEGRSRSFAVSSQIHGPGDARNRRVPALVAGCVEIPKPPLRAEQKPVLGGAYGNGARPFILLQLQGLAVESGGIVVFPVRDVQGRRVRRMQVGRRWLGLVQAPGRRVENSRAFSPNLVPEPHGFAVSGQSEPFPIAPIIGDGRGLKQGALAGRRQEAECGICRPRMPCPRWPGAERA